MFDLIIIGAGAAGIFASIQAKNKDKNLKVVVLEKTPTFLSKVKISGGGRCNITNATFDPKDLCLNYPRGHKELISAFHIFQPEDMIKWLEGKGVETKIEKDKKVFPKSDSSQTIIDCFLKEIKEKNIEIKFNQNILEVSKKNEYFEIFNDDGEIFQTKNLLLATGSSEKGLEFAKMLGHSYEPFIPSLFSFTIENSEILKLSGISKENVKVSIKNSSFSTFGSVLITHFGFSGPAIINLSSIAAKFLHEKNYKATLVIDWLNISSKESAFATLLNLQKKFPKKTFLTLNPFNLPNNLWTYLIKKFGNFSYPLQNISKKILFSLIENLLSDEYLIISKSQNKSEMVSCGGINLKEINFKTMQSKFLKNLYFAGEILNIDGITGGFNLQNAWTTGYIVGNSIEIQSNNN